MRQARLLYYSIFFLCCSPRRLFGVAPLELLLSLSLSLFIIILFAVLYIAKPPASPSRFRPLSYRKVFLANNKPAQVGLDLPDNHIAAVEVIQEERLEFNLIIG